MDTKKSKSEEFKYIPLEDDRYVWTSYDLGCCAALVCAGFELLQLNKENPRKALFVFKKQDGIEDVVDAYWSDRLEVKARAYFDTVKMLKNRLYSE